MSPGRDDSTPMTMCPECHLRGCLACDGVGAVPLNAGGAGTSNGPDSDAETQRLAGSAAPPAHPWNHADLDNETMVDLGGGMVVPLSELLGDEDEQ